MTAHALRIVDGSTPDLPFDLIAEQALLGALLISSAPQASVALILKREHFFEPLHQIIYGAIDDLATAGRPSDVLTVGAALSDLELPDGSPPIRVYLARLATEAVTVRDAPAWAVMIRDLCHRRELILAASNLSSRARSGGIDTSGASILDAFGEETRHISEARSLVSEETSGALAWRIVDEIEAARAGEFKVDAFTTGFSPLDELTVYRPEEVIVTAGRPGQGKSVFAACSARRQAEAGIGILELPLEIGREQAIARHITDLAYDRDHPICFSWILNRDVRRRGDSERIAYAVRAFERLPIIVDDAERITIPRLHARVRQAKAQLAVDGKRLGVVILDHLDFIDASDRYAGNRVQEIGEVMKGLKAIARREKVVVHLFCQLNRGVEGRDDKRPQLSDLRNSGDIEQVAGDATNLVDRQCAAANHANFAIWLT